MSQQNFQHSPQQPPIKSVSLPQRYPQIVNNPYQNVSSVAGSTDTLQSTLPSASPRPSQLHSYPNHQPSQYQPTMSAQEVPHHDSRNGRHPKPGKEIYTYHAPWPVYAMDWSKAPTEKGGFRLALGSFIEEHDNKLQIATRSDLVDDMYANQHSDFTVLAETDSYYPITKVLWEPWKGKPRSDLLATTGDILRLWELVDNPSYGSNTIGGRGPTSGYPQKLVKKSELMNVKQTDFCAPLTSFDWNVTDPSLVVTSSIDTTCTVWNVETNQAKTQLIAHDKDVYDVAFMHGTADIFASVGADGSVRMFDLRSLEHSTILYETPQATNNVAGGPAGNGPAPLLRLEFNRIEHHLLATFHMDSMSVQILDIRFPSTPVTELVKSHNASVNCISWAPNESGQICTGGDDNQVLVWDLNLNAANSSPSASGGNRSSHHRHHQGYHNGHQVQKPISDPILAYSAESEINSLSWNQSLTEWIGVGFGRTVQALRV
ncbi:hypothetical protein INT43_000379 [Umbelopsis isabellina]|uniref:WD40 repeat-like protein n=1 Tax=Mortierella isabellina TaxID=91625 RepID=A0A8H7Q372_MORIS|nr:hypothetical protein INT43_000379 [Umbelopsis isabellina]